MRVNLSHPQERERSPPIYYVKIRDGRNLVEDRLVDKIYDDYYGFDIFFKLDLIWEHLDRRYYSFWSSIFNGFECHVFSTIDLKSLRNIWYTPYMIQGLGME